ncbi:MAG TPA: histidine kinase [Solirubrobacteraceae bacterium]|nr:histidine kinase [Solirubrobacteraceae bacterium]
MLLLSRLDTRTATIIRLIGFALVSWTVFNDTHHPATGGRGLVVAVTWAVCAICWLTWTWRPFNTRQAIDNYVMALAGGVLLGAAPSSAASVFVFAAAVTAGLREPLGRAMIVPAAGSLATAVSVLIYDHSALGLLAYVLGFAAATLAASNARQSLMRAEQAELLLAQSQRSHEEQLRTARLEESTRIAREIHDVLAHSLAGLAIQLEATRALIEHGADRPQVLERVKRAHALAREGLSETRRAVGALRGDGELGGAGATPAGIDALVADYRSIGNAEVTVSIDGDAGRLAGETGRTLRRVVQESLTNVRKHAPGAAVSIALHGGSGADEQIELVVENGPPPDDRPRTDLGSSGGGYGLRGMRERAQALGGTLEAGATVGGGWRVRLRAPAVASTEPQDAAPALSR